MRLATHVGMPHTNHIINNTKTNNHLCWGIADEFLTNTMQRYCFSAYLQTFAWSFSTN